MNLNPTFDPGSHFVNTEDGIVSHYQNEPLDVKLRRYYGEPVDEHSIDRALARKRVAAAMTKTASAIRLNLPYMPEGDRPALQQVIDNLSDVAKHYARG